MLGVHFVFSRFDSQNAFSDHRSRSHLQAMRNTTRSRESETESPCRMHFKLLKRCHPPPFPCGAPSSVRLQSCRLYLNHPRLLQSTAHVTAESLCCRVGVHLSLAAGHGHVDEPSGVCYSLLGAALGGLLLLLRLDLWGLGLDFAGTGEGSVNFTHDCELLSS